jgi:hypothetical protein
MPAASLSRRMRMVVLVLIVLGLAYLLVHMEPLYHAAH